MWISYVEALNCGKLGGEPSQVGRVRWESGDVFGQGPEMDGFCNRNLWESYRLPFWRNPSTHQSIWTNNPLEVKSLAWKGQNHWTENSTSLHFWYWDFTSLPCNICNLPGILGSMDTLSAEDHPTLTWWGRKRDETTNNIHIVSCLWWSKVERDPKVQCFRDDSEKDGE